MSKFVLLPAQGLLIVGYIAFVASVGQLVALSRQEVVLDVQGDQGKIRLHFPRLEFAVTKAAST